MASSTTQESDPRILFSFFSKAECSLKNRSGNVKSGPSARRDFFSAEKSQVDIVFLVLPLLVGGALQDIRCGGVFISEYNLGNGTGISGVERVILF